MKNYFLLKTILKHTKWFAPYHLGYRMVMRSALLAMRDFETFHKSTQLLMSYWTRLVKTLLTLSEVTFSACVQGTHRGWLRLAWKNTVNYFSMQLVNRNLCHGLNLFKVRKTSELQSHFLLSSQRNENENEVISRTSAADAVFSLLLEHIHLNADVKIYQYLRPHKKNYMRKVSHHSTVYFLRYTHTRYIKQGLF